MAGLYLHDTAPEFAVERAESGDVELRVRAGGVTVHVNLGAIYGDVSLLADSLHHLAEDTREICNDWVDTPAEHDAYISVERGRYHVGLEGIRVGDYPSREVAEIALAQAMAANGVFPPAWYLTDHGNYLPIDADIRRWHNEAGDGMAELPDVQYQPGQRVHYTGDGFTHAVIGDWGPAGVEIHMYGDPSIRAHVTDRDQLAPVDD